MSRPPLLDAEALPEPEGPPVAIRIRPNAERVVRSGHPWLFEGSVVSESRSALAGEIAVIFDRKNRFLAAGLYDPESPIRIRLFVHGDAAQIGEGLFRTRIQAGLARRSDVASANTTALRLLHGENDGLPGLVADLYERTIVLRIDTVAWLPHLRKLLSPLRELLAPERILLLVSRTVAKSASCPPAIRAHGGVELHLGTDPTSEGTGGAGGVVLPFLETGLHFEAHPFDGQKTGFYLDQRENRRRLEAEFRGGRLLNVFSYTGAFSVYAARGNADEVVSVDRAAPALVQAERHFALNRSDPGVAACRHRTISGDGFRVMEELADRGERFQGIVVDPPSFTRVAAHRDRALAAYRRLTSLALSLLAPGGLLVQASCSARVEAEAFYAGIHEAARSRGIALEEVDRTGHPADHPVSFPEGAYLKCLWARLPE